MPARDDPQADEGPRLIRGLAERPKDRPVHARREPPRRRDTRGRRDEPRRAQLEGLIPDSEGAELEGVEAFVDRALVAPGMET